jgi:hypothetical protein
MFCTIGNVSVRMTFPTDTDVAPSIQPCRNLRYPALIGNKQESAPAWQSSQVRLIQYRPAAPG